jgi:Flp pilus assembly protein TadG
LIQFIRLALWHGRAFGEDRRGSIAIMSALCLPLVLGFAALSIEYGYGLLVRDENQRAADLASYAGALAYSNTNSEDQMREAALRVIKLNGIDTANATVSLTTSPKDARNQAVHVGVTTTNTLFLAPILGASSKLDIATEAYSSLGTAQNGCIIALDKSSTGVTLSGGVQVNAGNCYVASNSNLVAPCGTNITAKSATYDEGSSQPCPWSANILRTDGSQAPVTQQYTSDPLSGNAGISALISRFDTIRSASWPSKATVGTSPDVEFGGNSSPVDTASAIQAIGCTYDSANYNQYWTTKWDITCSGSKISIGSLLVHGNIQVNFNIAGGKNIIYSFSGKIQNDFGTKLVFGNGIFRVAKGVYGADLTFGAGTFHFGMGDQVCGDGRYSLCSSGKVLIGGPSTFILNAGFYTGAGATLKLGAGTANSYTIGKSSSNNGIGLDGGSITYLADATTGTGGFRVNGNINGGGGGSCITIPAGAQHDISGNVNLAGGARLGAGIYTIDGYFSANTGGASCGDPIAISGKDVTLVVSGITTPSDWECGGKAFCLTGGNAISLTAPQSGSNANLAVIGPQSSGNIAGAEITSGGIGTISGAFYFPSGKIDFGGGGSLSNAPGGCLQLIGASISLSGGSQAMSECTLSTGSGKVALVQ